MEEKYYPVVVQAIAGDNYMVYAYFTDGTIHEYDMKPLLRLGGVFSKLLDEDFFRNRITVLNSTVAWDLSGCYDPCNCVDIDPYDVYEAIEVEDPLMQIA